MNRSWRILHAVVAAAISIAYVNPAHTMELVRFEDLRGWADDDHAAALATFRLSCQEIVSEGRAFERPVRFGGTRKQWVEICRKAGDVSDPRAFFEANFLPFRVADPDRTQGLFTGYFEPEAAGSRLPSAEFNVPIYARPPDLVAFSAAQQRKTGLSYGRLIGNEPRPYLSRQEIEQGALSGKGLEVLWLKDWADAFFIHIQGSGRVRLADGSIIRLAYGAKSGLPYTGIGALLVERGVFTRENMSMQATRAWMAENPESARKLMWQNESFIFFREIEGDDPHLGPIGAQKVQLTPRRSIAIDRRFWMFGTPVWLETTAPAGKEALPKRFASLLIAQDTGSAIKGLARGDVFWGAGEDAALTAGHMKSPGTMTVLLPLGVARNLGLRP